MVCWAMHHPLFSSRSPSRPTALRLGILCTLLSLSAVASPSRADLVPEPPPECTGKPDGTFCSQGDGTAGLCATEQDARRPGRSYRVCRRDKNECDRLAIGAVCHGYLGKPSHCREFHNAERNERWRTCQADDIAAPATAAPAGTPTAAPATASAAASDPAPATAVPAVSKPKGMFGCSQAGGTSSGPFGLFMAALSVALAALVSRRSAVRARQA